MSQKWVVEPQVAKETCGMFVKGSLYPTSATLGRLRVKKCSTVPLTMKAIGVEGLPEPPATKTSVLCPKQLAYRCNNRVAQQHQKLSWFSWEVELQCPAVENVHGLDNCVQQSFMISYIC